MKGFDPYHKWLGIPPEEQPPNHYRLLGLNVFESDLEVIEAAADRQMAYLQSCASGEHVEASQNLLNRVSTARVCLLNSDMKAAYDAKLPRPSRRLLSKRQVKTYVIVALLGVTVLTIFLLVRNSSDDVDQVQPQPSEKEVAKSLQQDPEPKDVEELTDRERQSNNRLLDSALAEIDRAVEADEYEIADQVYTTEVSLASRTSRREEVLERRTQFRVVQKAIKTLKESPNDADANLEVGRFYFLLKGDWEQGLPMLAKGSDAALKSLAARDVAGASDSSEQLALAEAWSKFSTSQEGTSKVQPELRAISWYLDALPGLSAPAKVNVEKLLDQFRKQMVDEANTNADEHHGIAGTPSIKNVYLLNVESVGRERLLKFWFRSVRYLDSAGEVSLIDPDGKKYVVHSWSPNDFKKSGPVKSLDDWNAIVVDVTAGVKKPGRYKVVFQYKSGRDRIGVRRVQINTGRYPPQARLAASAF